jgi:DNA-binding NarL/FixJ family response regulator
MSLSSLSVYREEDDDASSETQEFGQQRRDPLWQKRANHWILLVDDEASIRNAVGQLLFDKGYQVTACADAKKAFEVALNRPSSSTQGYNGGGNDSFSSIPDCIVSDIRMPGMDGLEFLRRIRADERLMEVPVVLLTAKGMTKDRIEGYNLGADSYLTKPFDPEELVVVVDNVIDRHKILNGRDVKVDDLKKDLDEIKYLLLENGGGGVGKGFVEKTDVFLAPDEREVLELLCQGLITKEIADKAYLSTRRVEQLLTRMFRKTGVKNRTELVRWALSTGNVQL